jgi:hypothetical protein
MLYYYSTVWHDACLKSATPEKTGVLLSSSTHIYTWRKEMSFLTSTLMVETGLWDALKTRTQKFGKSFMQGCVRYGEARARAAMKMHNLGMYYDN